MDSLNMFEQEIDKLNISLLFCEKFDEKSKIWNFNSHKHDSIELLYFLHGNAEVMLGQKSVSATFYDTIVYPKDMYHTELLQANKHQEIICIWVDIPGLELADILHFQDKDGKLKWLLESLHEEYKSDAPCDNLIKYYLKSIAILIARKYYSNQAGQDNVSRIKIYMQNNMSQPIMVEDLADLVYVSKSYLGRVFKRETGLSLMEYLRAIRIEQAKTLLVSKKMSVEEIAATVGYSCPKHFYKAFSICTNMSPTKYRNNERQNNANPTN